MAKLKWTGKYTDQRAGAFRVLWSSGAWTLQRDGKRVSRHDSRDGAKRKAAKLATAPRVLPSLGPSNDASVEVKVEIRAAELEIDRSDRRVGERWGWEEHESGDDVADDPLDLAGWLHREIVTHDDRATRDAPGWDWDVARSIADQALEIKAQHNAIGALCDAVRESGATMTLYGQPVTEGQLRAHAEQIVDAKLARITEQTRHDVAASVKRHADLDAKRSLTGQQPEVSDPVLPPLTPAEERVEDLMSHAAYCALCYDDEQYILASHGLVRLEIATGDEPESGAEFELVSGPHADVKTIAQERIAIDVASRPLTQAERAEVECIFSDVPSDEPATVGGGS